MVNQISVVINTFNEERNIRRAMESVAWADEIIVCDMYSGDKTVEIAKKMGAKVILHKMVGYVELARNYAISKASFDWVLVLDADESVPEVLARKIRELIAKPNPLDYVEIPRKNIIFGKWMSASMWWPDYQVRLFKKGSVLWNEKIHTKPDTKGEGLKLQPEEKWAIVHQNYQGVSQFIERMNRYSDIQAKELQEEGYKFSWKDLLQKPLNEFLARFFANKGYKDGLHGLSLSLLQAFSFLVVYMKVWEKLKFSKQEIDLSEFKAEVQVNGKEIDYWFKNENQTSSLLRNRNFLKKIYKIFK